ncbi:unnamed protein product, partial [Closterium sp. NIES-53]
EEARKLMEGMEQQQQQQESEEETDAEQRAERARLMDGGAAAGERGATGAADRLGAAVSGERESAAAGVSGNHSSGNHVVSASGDDEDPAKVQLGQEQREQEGEGDDGEQQEQQQEHAGVSPVRVGEAGTGVDSMGGGGVSHPPTLNGTSSRHRTTRRRRKKGSRRRRQPLPPLSETCDLYSGEWVRDSQHHPLYSGSTCQFPLPHWTCRRKDRPSFLYEQFRWQPEGCRVPWFNRTELKERLRNKKVAFVGDSVGLQQFFSFLCLISPTPRTHEPYIESRDADFKFNWTTGWRGWQGSAYRFPETNTTVLLKWTTSLCHVARKDWANESAGQAAHLDQPDEFLRQHMEEMDVIIMNTGHHWNINKMQEYRWQFHLGGLPVPPDTHKQMEGDFNVPMRTVLRSSAMWVHRHLQEISEERERRRLAAMREGERREGAEGEGEERALPLVLLVTRSPAHFMDGQWNTGGGCDKLQDGKAPRQPDCMHWCLPGVSDAWNELLFWEIVRSSRFPLPGEVQGRGDRDGSSRLVQDM